MKKLLLSVLFLVILIFPSYVYADGPYLNIPPTNAFDKIHSDNGTITAQNFSMPLTVKGGSGIQVKSNNATHTLQISSSISQASGTYNTTQANNVNINSGGYKINFINGTGATVNLKNSGSGNQVNVTISATGTSSGVSSLNALTGALTIACVSGNTTCTTSGGNTITVNTAYNVVVTNGAAQTITKGITHTADVTMSGANIKLINNKLTYTGHIINETTLSGIDGNILSTVSQFTNSATNFLIYPTGTAKNAVIYINRLSNKTSWELLQIGSDVVTSHEFGIRSVSNDGTNNPIAIYIDGIKEISFNTNSTVETYVNELLQAKIAKYNNINTAGWGVPAIYGSGRLTGLTAASGTVTSYTVGGSDGTFEVSGDILATTSTSYTFKYLVTWTDESGTARTLPLQGVVIPSAIVSPTVQDTRGPVFSFPPETIRAKAGTTITLATDPAGTYTTITYNIDGIIKQVS